MDQFSGGGSGILAGLSGIRANAGTGAVTIGNTGTITAVAGDGVQATTGGAGTVGVTNTATITAAMNGISTSAGGGATTIGNSSAITAATGNGVQAISTAGTIDIVNTAAVTSQAASAIRVQNDGAGASTIRNSAALRGSGASTATAVISVSNAGASPTTITNLGDIRSNTGAPGDLADYAIASTTPAGGAITISNAQTIRGRISLTNAADAFTNLSGASWETTGLSSFGDGANTFTNAAGAVTRTWGATTIAMGNGAGNVINNGGQILLRNGANGTTAVTSFTAGAPSNLNFNNSGLIDLSNDGANLVSNRVNIQGNFISSGASLIGVNTQLGGVGSVSDRVFIDGNSTGTGTGVVVKDTLGGVGAANAVGIAVVGVKGSNSAPDFVLNGASDHFKYRNGQPVLDKGLYFYYMDRSPSSTGCDNGYTCFSLFSAPTTAARTLPIAVTTAQTIWQEDALMWEDRQVELRDELMMRKDRSVLGPAPASTADGAISTWVKTIGSWTNRSNSLTSWGGGGRALSYDLGYRQNVFSMLGGANITKAGVFNRDDYLIAGVMGGYLQSNVNFNQEAGNLLGPAQFSYSGGTVGGSLSYLSHGFFADGLLKADMLGSNLYIPVAGLTNSRAGVWTAGGVGNVGYRYDWRQFFIEPIATFTYSVTAIGSVLSPANNLSMKFGGGNDFRGGFGGRVGFILPALLVNHVLEASLTGRYWNVFNANGGRTIDITSGGVSDTLGDYTFGRDYGEVKGNLDMYSLGPGWSAFVNTGVRWNAMWTTVTTKGGLAYRW